MNNIDYDLTLLKLLSTKEALESYSDYVDYEALAEETKILLKDYQAYYVEFPEIISFDWLEFSDFFFNKQHKAYRGDVQKRYKNIFDKIQNSKEMSIELLLKRLKEESVFDKLLGLKEVGASLDKMRDLLEKHTADVEVKIDNSNVLRSVEDLNTYLESTDRSKGLSWSLTGLNRCIGRIIKGDLILVGAYINVGKTAFCVSQVAHMLPQIADDSCCLYFNNEGPNERVFLRILTAMSGQNISYIKEKKEEAVQWYLKQVKGNPDKFRIIECAGKNSSFVEAQCRKYKPSLIIIDQLDKLLGGNTEHPTRAWVKLYGWARGLACKYGPVIALGQAATSAVKKNQDGDLEYRKWLTMSQLDWSGNAKQGEAEVIVLIGAENETSPVRYFSIPKNKPMGGIDPNCIHFTAILNRELNRYEDPK